MSAIQDNPRRVVPPWTQADRLVKARRFADLDQKDLADYLGLSARAISSFEKGAPIRIAYLRGWAERCGVDVAWLVTGNPEDPSTIWYRHLMAGSPLGVAA